MLNIMEVHETNKMIEQEQLDVRTITMGICLLACAADSVDEGGLRQGLRQNHHATPKDLVATGKAIEQRVRHPDRQQAHLRHPDCPGRRKLPARARTTSPPSRRRMDRAAKKVRRRT